MLESILSRRFHHVVLFEFQTAATLNLVNWPHDCISLMANGQTAKTINISLLSFSNIFFLEIMSTEPVTSLNENNSAFANTEKLHFPWHYFSACLSVDTFQWEEQKWPAQQNNFFVFGRIFIWRTDQERNKLEEALDNFCWRKCFAKLLLNFQAKELNTFLQ